MDRVPASKIRKLQWGIIPQLPTRIISVGSKGPSTGYIVCEIQEDKNTYYDLGYIEYLVYIKKEKAADDTKILWQRFAKIPDSVEYDLDGSEEVNV